MDMEIKDYISNLNKDNLEEVVSFELIGGNKSSLPRYMIVTHLVTHGGFHRGILAGNVWSNSSAASRARYNCLA